MAIIKQEEYERIREIKQLDLEICDYGHVNILNLGRETWGKWFCQKHEKEHVLCPGLCLPVSRNILRCELVRKRTKRTEEPPKPNKPYDWANCYLCGKELRGAGKHGVVKNRNNPGFWGLSIKEKVLCLNCLQKFQEKMSQRKKYLLVEYLKRYER